MLINQYGQYGQYTRQQFTIKWLRKYREQQLAIICFNGNIKTTSTKRSKTKNMIWVMNIGTDFIDCIVIRKTIYWNHTIVQDGSDIQHFIDNQVSLQYDQSSRSSIKVLHFFNIILAIAVLRCPYIFTCKLEYLTTARDTTNTIIRWKFDRSLLRVRVQESIGQTFQ